MRLSGQLRRERASLNLAWWERRWADVVHFNALLDEQDPRDASLHRGICAASLVFLGELDPALDMAEQSRTFADRTGMPTVQSLAVEMQGRVYSARRRAGMDGPDGHPFLVEAHRLATSVGSVGMQAAVCTEMARQAFLDERYADAVEPLRFVCEYHLTDGHWNPEDLSIPRRLIEALDRSGRPEAAAALTALVDGHRLTLPRLREVVGQP